MIEELRWNLRWFLLEKPILTFFRFFPRFCNHRAGRIWIAGTIEHLFSGERHSSSFREMCARCMTVIESKSTSIIAGQKITIDELR